jgi:hypothetical protein
VSDSPESLRVRRPAIAIGAVIALLVAIVGVRAATSGGDEEPTGIESRSTVEAGDEGDRDKAVSDTSVVGATAGTGATTSDGIAATDSGAAPQVATPGPRTPLPGVTDDEITVVYYWKGDRTRTSPYLAGTGAEANVDEAEAFRKLVDHINANAGGGATLMGHPIDLHGRRIKPVVVEAGQDAESFAAAAEQITKELRPFAAVAAHGSISTYLCPALAAAGIHNLSTYDLAGGLIDASEGYCLPSGMTWEKQVELTEAYLLEDQRENDDRVYGVVYAEYPGLVDSAPRMVERLRDAGVNIAEVATLSASLTTAQQQASNVAARMRAAGVNTIVMPDAGAPINFTHAAQSQGYNPDYYVWPCSGQDTMGMVRLLNPAQWTRAAGLTCYDETFASDLTNDAEMRETEWYAAYRSAAPNSEPPAPTPFVYAALLPLVVGIEGAGPDLTLETYRAALDRFEPYRYDAIEGRTDDATNMQLGVRGADRGLLLDAIRVEYNAGRQRPGSVAPGTYDFPERRRYATRSDFE